MAYKNCKKLQKIVQKTAENCKKVQKFAVVQHACGVYRDYIKEKT
jgi:hypothetical protein